MLGGVHTEIPLVCQRFPGRMTAALFFSAGYVVHIDCPVHAVDVFHVLGQQAAGGW